MVLEVVRSFRKPPPGGYQQLLTRHEQEYEESKAQIDEELAKIRQAKIEEQIKHEKNLKFRPSSSKDILPPESSFNKAKEELMGKKKGLEKIKRIGDYQH